MRVIKVAKLNLTTLADGNSIKNKILYALEKRSVTDRTNPVIKQQSCLYYIHNASIKHLLNCFVKVSTHITL